MSSSAVIDASHRTRTLSCKIASTAARFSQRAARGWHRPGGAGRSLLATIAGSAGGWPQPRHGGLPGLPHFPPKAKRVIYLFQSGAPRRWTSSTTSRELEKYRGQDLPDSIRKGQRLTGMTSGQKTFPVAPSIFKFAQHGQSGAWLSELLPHTAKVADDLCFIRSMYTEAINHDPAITFFQTGSQLAGRPSIGSWLVLRPGQREPGPAGLRGADLAGHGPARRSAALRPPVGQRASCRRSTRASSSATPATRCCTSPTRPAWIAPTPPRDARRPGAAQPAASSSSVGDPEIATRIAQYELAFRMQASVPDLTDISKEPTHVLDMYGPEVRKPGTFAANCLLARRLAERGVRFVQLFHMGWDQHGNLPATHSAASAATPTSRPRR